MKSKEKIDIGGRSFVQLLNSSKPWTIVYNILQFMPFLWMIFEATKAIKWFRVWHTVERNVYKIIY